MSYLSGKHEIAAIGVVKSCYKQKFGIPRQSGLVTGVMSFLKLIPPFDNRDFLRGIESFSHVWVIFHFHGVNGKWQPVVRPPRLGGKIKLGVFATRSPFRPNNLGLSVGKIEKVSLSKPDIGLYLSGLDLLDGTPVFDIKPYILYADAVINAESGFASNLPASDLVIQFSQQAKQQCEQKQHELGVDLFSMIEQILLQDPRPAYKQVEGDQREYGMGLFDFNLRWKYLGNIVTVISLW